MKKRNINGIISIVLCIVVLCTFFSACTFDNKSAEEKNTESSTAETTTQTTTVELTTENLSTTFPEKATQKVYSGLNKDKNGSYPYEISSYTTYYNSKDSSRTANLKAAAEKLDNIVIPSSQVFSFNQTVGKRTVTAGYQTATVISDGEFVDGLGGGVCQVSSTVFQCVLRANVEIVSRTNHTLEISYVPLGADATVQWNSKDFKFKNTLGCDVRLSMTCNNGKLVCKLYAKENIDVGNVKINISSKDGVYTLTRTVDGKKNYTTKSEYKKAESKTTTEKGTTKKSKEKTTKSE